MNFQQNRSKVLAHLPSDANGFLLMHGEVLASRKYTDVDLPFRQESNFLYLTGCNDPGCSLLINVATQESWLFLPTFDASSVMWHGESPSVEFIKQKTGIKNVGYIEELASVLVKVKPLMLYFYDDEVTHETLPCPKDTKLLKAALTEARLKKSPHEIECMRKACEISGFAHMALMKSLPKFKNEMQASALFYHECSSRGAIQAYLPICASGINASVLPYNANNAPITPGLFLTDAGCEVEGYASDITRAIPHNGSFDQKAKEIYNIVLKSQLAVIVKLKPGVEYEKLHQLALEIICDGLIQLGLIKGYRNELLKNDVPAVFFPHGLGHMIGLDVHDVGGYPSGVERIDRPGWRYLRMRRTLEEGHVVTIEPGLYFVESIIKAALESPIAKYFDIAKLNEYKSVGGVRIEDVVLITSNGCDVLSKAIPKTVDEIEGYMKH